MDDGAAPPTTTDEAARLSALRRLALLDSEPEPRFDRIVRTAAMLFGAPQAAIVLVDEDRLWRKAQVGMTGRQYPRAGSLADLMIGRREVTISGDIAADPRFSGLLAAPPEDAVLFFACAPLVMPDGEVVGLLTIGDPQPRGPATPEQRTALEDLAALAAGELLRDVEASEASQRRMLDQQRVELALEAAGLGEFEWDVTADKIYVSERLRSLTGVTGGAVNDAKLGEVSFRYVHPDDKARVREQVEVALRETGRYACEYRIVRPDDGRVRWMQGSGVLVRGQDGVARRVIGVVQDITARKEDEEQRETLLAELDHRVKNVLATVQSLAAQSARKTTSLDSFLKTFAGRLKAMASAHELLTATRWRGAALGHIAAAELGGLAPGQARWEGPEVLLTPRAANALSLALHELATNAVKFGALSVDAGRVLVTWRLRDGGGFSLDWVETGGPPVSPPARRGFGATLLEKVTGRELGGTVRIDHRPGGVRANIQAHVGAIADAAQPTAPAPQPDKIAETLAGASAGEGGGAASVKGLRVLIVEDAVLLALELEAGLTEAGAKVVGSAAEVEEALAMLDLDFDAAVLDANLNGKSVLPVAAKLKARGTPFVFATGYGEVSAPEDYDAPIVRKPYNIHQIVRALAQAMGTKS